MRNYSPKGYGFRQTGTRSRGASFLFLALLIVSAFLAAFVPSFLNGSGHAYAQTKSFHMDQYNADITINQDGSFDVVETLVYVYDQGQYHRGTRTIPLSKVDSISNVQVDEIVNNQPNSYRETSYDADDSTSGVPGTFGTETSGGNLNIRWVYPYTENASRTYNVRYHVVGGTRVYSDRDEFDWYAIPQDWASPINRSRVQVNVPAGTDVASLKSTSSPSSEASTQNGALVWSLTNPDNGLEVGVQFPKGILQPVKPSWQASIDAREAFRKDYGSLADVITLLAGVLAIVGGVLWSIMTWYRKGRDKPVKLVSDYITEPPSNLPPGLVGTLLDESADVRDVIATVADQGSKGNLTIQETKTGGIGGLFAQHDFQYSQTGTKVQYKFEDMVLNAIFKHGNPTNLSDLKNTFYSDLPPIYSEMYSELVGLKYFPDSPQSMRGRNIMVGVFLIVLSAAAAFAALMVFDYLPLLILIPMAIFLTGLIRLVTAGSMVRKTDFGAEEAEKWRAFGRYLEQIQRYTDVQAAAGKFQQYLPYAVAMGIERQLIGQFNSVPAAMPPWYAPYGYNPVFYPYATGSSVGGGQTGGGSGGGAAMPNLDPGAAMQGMSDSLASAMNSMSDSFTSMVNSASSALTSAPQSSGGSSGGWGGGGGSFGGGGGGGGGGGAD